MRLPVKKIQRIILRADRLEWRGMKAAMRATLMVNRLGFAAHRAGVLADKAFIKARGLRQWALDLQESYGNEARKREERHQRQMEEAELEKRISRKAAPRKPKMDIHDLF